MKRMMNMMVAGLLTAVSMQAFAVTMYTNEVNGIKWVYTLSGGKATLGGGNSSTPAIVGNPTGKVEIPSAFGETQVVAIASYAFNGKSGIEDVTVPNNVTNIGNYAFQNCSSTTNVVISNGVQYIGYGAFTGCTSLRTLTLPFVGSQRGNANGYGDNFGYVFGSSYSSGSTCVRQNYYYNNGNNSSYSNYYIPTNLTSLVVTDETLLRPYAFQNCTMLTNIVANDTITSVGNYTFSGCTGLRSFRNPDSVKSVGSYAFSGCSLLSTVSIPNSVRWIGSYAFQNCSRLAEINLPEGVGRIYDYAFSGCSQARSVAIPSTVTNIGSCAFQNCSALTSIAVPESVEYMGYGTFGGCYRLSSITLPFVGSQRGNANGQGDNFGYVFGSSSSTGSTSVRQNYYYNNGNNSSYATYYIPTNLTSVVVADETLLRPYAFQNCTMLTNIVINSEVSSIGSYAFSGCTGIRAFTIPDSAMSIGNYAFSGCSMLSELVVPANVRSIGSYAFQNCSNMASIRILSDYVAIDQYAFYGCPASIFDTTSVSGLKLMDGYVVGTESTLSGAVDLSATRGVVANAFSGNTKITRAVLPEGMTLIPASAFYGCSALSSIAIPDTVRSIGSSAFSGCSSLTSITLPGAVTSIGDYAFNGCRNITSIILPENVQSIGYCAFASCTSLRNVTIPTTLKTIGTSAFSGDSNLATVNIKDLTAWCKIVFADVYSNPVFYSHALTLNGEVIHDLAIPDGLSRLQDYAFYNNYALTSVAVPDGIPEIPHSVFYRCGGITNVVLPESVANIGPYAFQGCTNLTAFPFPMTVTNIANYAFAECSGLAALELPANLLRIGNYSFQKCHGISEVEIPQSVVSIGQYAFNTCTNLANVTVHNGLVSIGNSAFSGCARLTVSLADDFETVPSNLFRYCGGIYDVAFPESVTNIASSAFYGCSLITRLNLPDSLKRIADYAFYGCTALDEVVIPEGVTSIGQCAFGNCTKLTRAVIPSTVKSVGQYAFSGCSQLASVDLAEGAASVGNYAFQNCTSLTNAVIPATVKTVGESAFNGCTGLKSVSLPDGLVTIENYAFRNCRSLTSLDIPSSVREIGEYAFEGCNALLDLSIPDGVAMIGNHAFYACTNLVSLSVPASATNIGWYAFAACSNLTQVTLLTTPSRIIPTADLSLEDFDWSLVDGDTIRADSKKLYSQMTQEAKGQGVLSFEWRTPGYWYHSSYYNTDSFSSYGYFSFGIDYWYSEYSSGSYYSDSCNAETWSPVAISTSSSSRHTIDWFFDWNRDYVSNGEVDPSADFGSIRSLSFVPSRTGDGNGVDGTVVGASAFEGCVKLARVDIEDVAAWCGTIFENAWANPLRYAKRLYIGGEEMRNLAIPDTVDAVAGWAFADCGGITNIVFPEGFTSVGTHAFQNTAIGGISLPSSVTNVGSFAFAGCDGVKSIILPVGLRKINDFAFSGQTKVLSATLPSGTALSRILPDSLGTIREIVIPDGETEVVDNAFEGCTALESVDIPDTVLKIGQMAFKDCARLTSVALPPSANSVWNNAFDGCLRLRGIAVDNGNGSYTSENGVLFDDRTPARLLTRCPEAMTIKDYSIPEGVARVGGYSFMDCVGIETVLIPASVTNIAVRAFLGCSSLTRIDVSEDNPVYASIDGVLISKDGKTLLRYPPAKAGHYNIPDGVEAIAAYAFEECGRLASLSFGADVKSVEVHAFDGCTFMSQAVLNDGLERIGDYAFEGCASLAAVTIPESVTSLGEGAFDGCDQLESLSVPENIAVRPKNIGGIVRGNVSLYRGCIYNVTNDLIVMGGATLKIPSGVVLKMNSWRLISVLKGGRLVATGTRAAPVVITSGKDDEFGGDTNGDGNATSPQGGDWGGIRILGEAELAYTRIRYGQQAYYGPGVISVSDYQYYDDYYYWDFDAEWMDFANYYDDDARLTMDGCVVEHSTVDSWTVGVSNEGGSVVARNCVFFDLPSGVAGYAQYSGNSYTMADQTNHFVNCVFHGCNSIVMDDWYNVDSTAAVFDNCVFSEMVEWVGGYGESIPSDLSFRNCCFWNPEDDEFHPIQTNALIGVAGNVWGNPRFENANVGDFHIKAGSACIDAGREESAPVRDYFGQPRNGAPDIGIHEIQVRPVNDADLAALAISGDAEASIGGTINVMWTVGNVGTTNIVDEWRDIVELVDSVGHAVELGRRTVVGGLAAGANLSFSATYVVPSMSSGTARLRLKVNPYRDIYEGTLTANNVCLSEATVEIVLPAYDPVANSSFELRAGGSVALRVPAGSGTTAFKLTGSGNASIAAYALAGGVPAGLRYDVASVLLADGSILLVLPKNAAETDYNIAVFNDGTSSTTVSMEPVTESVSVLEVTPARLANTGEGHLTIIGTGMDRVSTVRLEGAVTITATKFRADSSANLSATFDLSGANVGSYAVVLVDEDGATHRTDQSVEVYSPKIGPKLEAWLELPSATRQGRVYTGRICYRNSGDEDMAAPCLSLSVESALVGLDFDEITFTKLDVLAIGAVAPQGMLKAGEENYIGFWFKSGAEPRFQLNKLSGTSEAWKQSVATMSEAASVLNQRGRPAVSLESLQPYVEAVEEGERNIAAICGHVITSDEVTSTITVFAETEDGQYVASDEVDGNGVFILDGLANATNYVVKVSGGAVAEAVSVEMPTSGDINGLMMAAIAKRTLTISVEGVPNDEVISGVLEISVGVDGETVQCGLTNVVSVSYASSNAYDVIYYTATLDSGRVDSGCLVVSPYDGPDGMVETIDFSEAVVVKGHVLDNEGQPFTDAVVRVRAEDFSVLAEIFVDDDGMYTVGGLDAGRYVMDAYVGGRTSPSQTIVVGENGVDVIRDLTLPDAVGGTIRFEISTDAEDCLLVVENCNKALSDSFVVSNGVFTITDVPSGEYDAYLVDSEGRLISDVERMIVDGGVSSVLLQENQHLSLSGMLLNSKHEGVAGVIVLAPAKGNPYHVVVSENGEIEADVPVGKYWLASSAKGCNVRSCYLDLKESCALTIELCDAEEIDDDDSGNEAPVEGEGLTCSVMGVANVDSDVSMEFLSEKKQIVALFDILPPSGPYALNSVPTQYSHVWLTDNYGHGELLNKADFTAQQSRIEIVDEALNTISVRVFGDEAHTVPLPDVSVIMTGAYSNVIYRTTDATGVARFKVSSGRYSIFASRAYIGEGTEVVVDIADDNVFAVNYVLSNAVGDSVATWLDQKGASGIRAKAMMRAFSFNSASSDRAKALATRGIGENIRKFGSDLKNKTVERLGLMKMFSQHFSKLEYYIEAAADMYKEEPSFKCAHNMNIWKRYRVARIKFDGAVRNARYDEELLKNALTRLGLMILYKAPNYIPGSGWAYGLSSSMTEMVVDIKNQKEQEALDKAADIQQAIDDQVQQGELDQLTAQKLNFENALTKEEQVLADLQTKQKQAEQALKQAKNELYSYNGNGNWAKINKLENELKSIENQVANQRNLLNGLRKRYSQFLKTTGKKLKSAAKYAKKIEKANLAVQITTDLIDLYEYAKEVDTYARCFMSDIVDIGSAFAELAAAYNTPYHTHAGDCEGGDTNTVCLVGRVEITVTNRLAEASINVRTSSDPNEIVGELGVGDHETKRFVKPGQELTYTIYFENKSDAETAAQEIRVTETLDPALDWSTFRLGEVAFNNQIDNNLSGYQSGTSEVKMNGTNYYVRTEASFDLATGRVSWYLRIVDKTTADEWPTDLHAGILPPNDGTFRGEGHVTYRVNVRNDAPPGSLINASASIVFDYNEPIITDPAWWNQVAIYHTPTLDLGDDGTTNLLLIAGQPFGELPTPPERKNHTFDGWYTGLNGTGIKATPDAIVPEGDFELYQNWIVDGGIAKFEECEVLVGEGSNAIVRVYGGSADSASSVKVHLTYQTASAVDVNLKKGTVDSSAGGDSSTGGAPVQNAQAARSTNLKFPLTLTWAKGEIGEKVITIPVKKDSLLEGDEVLTLQLSDAVGVELGDARICTVTVRDAQWPEASTLEEQAARGRAAVPSGAKAVKDGNGVAVGYWTTKDKKGNVTAYALPGYALLGWYDAKGKKVSSKATITDKDRKAKKLTPQYKVTYLLRALSDPPDGGTVTGGGVYVRSKSVTLKAKAAKYFTFDGWVWSEANAQAARSTGDAGGDSSTGGSPVVLTSPSLKVKVTTNVTYFAKFTPYPKVAVKASSGGTVKGAGSYLAGQKATLAATPKKGYAFTGWWLVREDGTKKLLSLDATYKYKVPAAGAAITASFKKESKLAAPTLTWGDYVVNSGTGGNSSTGGSPVENAQAARSTNLTVGVSYSAKLKVSGEAKVSIVKVAELPKGLTYKSGKVSGVPTTKKGYSVKVTVALDSNPKKTWDYAVPLRVSALPSWAAGTFTGPLLDKSEKEKGTVTLTVGKTGKVSGKFVNLKQKQYSFATDSFASYVDGVLRTSAAMKYGSKTVTVEIAVGQDGETSVGFAEVGSASAPFSGNVAVLLK